MTPETLDRMRRALAACTFVAGHPHKRFARDIAAVPIDRITDRQRAFLVGLCWRYRRQIPRDLVPSKDAAEALHAAVKAAVVAREIRKREAREQRVIAIAGPELPL